MYGAIGLFLLCGFTAVLNDTLTPYLQLALKLNYTQVAWIPGAFYLGYFLASPAAGFLFRARDPVVGMRMGAAVAGLGAASIAITSATQIYFWILCAIFVMGCGIALIQVCTNLYVVTATGSAPSAARLTLTQAFTNVGTIAAPAFGATFVLGRTGSATPLLLPYLAVGLLWGLLFLGLRRLPPSDVTANAATPIRELLRDRAVRYSFLFISLAVGIEISIASFLTQYLLHLEGLALTLEGAGRLTILFWGGFLVGRLAAHPLLLTIPPLRLLIAHCLAGTTLALVALSANGAVAAGAVLGLGLCCSVLFPILYTVIIQSTQANRAQVSGILCMGNLGGALLPMMHGALADRAGLHLAMAVPAAAFILLASAAARYQSKTARTLASSGA